MYGSANDLPSYQELSRLIRGGKLITRFFARGQRQELIEAEQQLKRMVRIVDEFYGLLGSRNWIFHDMLNLKDIENLLAESNEAGSAELRLISLYRNQETIRRWITRLRRLDGLRTRSSQIDRALEHYESGYFDSCTMHLIAVMDGFLNDFEPAKRKGLHARAPEDMAVWDSVINHHLGLTHAMETFTKKIKKRVDHEVHEVFRHGIMHGTVVSFDNVVVATKAWNMLFSVGDWAIATREAEKPKEPQPTFRDVITALSSRGRYRKYEKSFVASKLEATDVDFNSDEIVAVASEFLEAWRLKRWALVARFTPPMLRSDQQAALNAKAVFDQYNLEKWSIDSRALDRPSTAEILAKSVVNGDDQSLRFRLVYWTTEGIPGIPDIDEGEWTLAMWSPRNYFSERT